MLGLMQDWPLLCHRIIDHAATNAAERPIVSRSIEGPMHTTNYAEIRRRALRVAQRLERDGGGLVTGWQRLLGILGGISRAGTAFSESARSIIRSIRACSPIRSRGSSITRKTA